MPNAKRVKIGGKPRAGPSTPTSDDPQGSSEFSQLANQHWLKAASTRSQKRAAKFKVKNDVIKTQIWDVLEKANFPFRSLLELEGLRTLESYLWPGYGESASKHHVLLIVLLVNAKQRERLESWTIFADRPDDFSGLVQRVLYMSLDETLLWNIRTHVLRFTMFAFHSLDHTFVRQVCAPLVSISVWHHLSTETKRDTVLEQHPRLRKAWRASVKRYESADKETQARLRFERSWLFTMVLNFLNLLFAPNFDRDQIMYCERFVEFLADLQSQLPTRRYINTLLQDLHVLPALSLSPMYSDEDNVLLRDLTSLLLHYTRFSIDDQTGAQLTRAESYDRHCKGLAKLQHASLKHFKEKLAVLALSNYGSIDQRHELQSLLAPLDDDELLSLVKLLKFRTEYPNTVQMPVDRKFLLEVLIYSFERCKSYQEMAQDINILPNEESLFENSLLQTEDYDGSRPLALPKLNLQYLSVGDFLWRSLVLYRCESFYGIRSDIELALRRLQPKTLRSGDTGFSGFTKMALPIARPNILEVLPPLVGDTNPSAVRAEITIDVSKLRDGMRRDWESLRSGDTVFLVAVDATQPRDVISRTRPLSEAQNLGLRSVRTAEIVRVLDNKGRTIRDAAAYFDGHRRSFTRKIEIKIDARKYKEDMELVSSGKPDIYDKINLVVRRSGRENNFKPVLESIRNLTLSDVPLASWLHEVFLGYGDPAGATYKHLPNCPKKIDYRDTFLDWAHLVESLAGKLIEPSADVSESFGPPYVLESVVTPAKEQRLKPAKKRRRDTEPSPEAEFETLKVMTYKPPNNGPYSVDVPKTNQIRFTPTQTEAIMSGTQPGLTVIVGPPGTGKTDVVTQIINNVYHDFPEQRTLLIARSNQALNQLFAKIINLDFDECHLLRLGHGEEELEAEGNFSKHGRVETVLEKCGQLLQEVNRLAASIGAPGAHGNSAETAGYFHSVYIEPTWTKFQEFVKSPDANAAKIVLAFPFHHYFSNAPQPLFPPDVGRDAILEIANGCYRHISMIFSELADVRPFEILRRDRERSNYLLANEARVIAMTSTHAAMRRGEISSLGFHYDNLVVEEAAQMTEIESFISLAMQKPKNGDPPLQRVVLCGDHFQNSPIIQNIAFRNFANLEQSLFSRLVRLGVPVISLDQQGRSRPSIASLYQWRYPGLGNLPHTQTEQEFLRANAGFKYEYQFINVPDYKGKGESEPTPHFIQNLGEAEYAVALYQYMCLLGYPAAKISILATYAGQSALIKDVLAHRCLRNPIFGLPRIVTTVDKYQGEQNDYIILSLTRTSRVGYLRDIRRLTVAVSRARLGLYILGRRELFESCYELHQAFDLVLQRPDKAVLVTGELWPSARVLSEEEGQEVPGEAVMESVEHIGQYIFEMTTTKLKELQAEGGAPMASLMLENGGRDEDEVLKDADEIEADADEAGQRANEGFEAEES